MKNLMDIVEDKRKKKAREAELYSLICNYIWFKTHKDCMEDGFIHTSPECRWFAIKVMEFMDKEIEENKKDKIRIDY